jgi:hypothetical protein
MNLGDMHVLEPYPPAKLLKALAVIADTMHASFDADPGIKLFYSRRGCVLSSLTVRDFLVQLGFKAIVRPVATVIWAERDGKMLHSLAIGAPHDKRTLPESWKGHLVVTVKFPLAGTEFLVDTTLYQCRRPQWPALPGMLALPVATKPVRGWWGLDLFASATMGEDVLIAWFDHPKNKSWSRGPDGRDPYRRAPTTRRLIERFERWEETMERQHA